VAAIQGRVELHSEAGETAGHSMVGVTASKGGVGIGGNRVVELGFGHPSSEEQEDHCLGGNQRDWDEEDAAYDDDVDRSDSQDSPSGKEVC